MVRAADTKSWQCINVTLSSHTWKPPKNMAEGTQCHKLGVIFFLTLLLIFHISVVTCKG